MGQERCRVKGKGVWLDNRWVIPYNPYLSKCYKAHINVEICLSICAFKYLFKYVFKDGNRTTAVLQSQVDKIQDYLDARYVSTPEAAWLVSNCITSLPRSNDCKFTFPISKLSHLTKMQMLKHCYKMNAPKRPR